MPDETAVKLVFDRPKRILGLWTVVLGGPIVWLSVFELTVILVPWACAGQGRMPAIHVSFAAGLFFAALSAWKAWGYWRETGESWPGEEAGTVSRSRFLAAIGVLLSSVSALVIAAQWITNFFLGPCQSS
jgi:hypothetical protein